jgi:hypothetical protein
MNLKPNTQQDTVIPPHQKDLVRWTVSQLYMRKTRLYDYDIRDDMLRI